MLGFLKRNAAWLASIVTAGVSLATAFGWQLTGDQVAAITSFTAVLLGGGIQVHANITSNGKVPQ